jgi:hypothetical protein
VLGSVTQAVRWSCAIVLELLLVCVLAARTPTPPNNVFDVDSAIADLRKVARDLNEAVKLFHFHIDEIIEKSDRGYQSVNGRPTEAADFDLMGGPADVVQETQRKFVAFRMLASRNERYQPRALADLDRIQSLIAQERKRAGDVTGILSRLLVVSARDIDPRRDAEIKARHDQLVKSRAAAEEAAKRAWMAMPIDLPEADSPEEAQQKAWDLLIRSESVPKATQQTRNNDPAPAIALHIERRKRTILVNYASYRMALTDSGLEDDSGQHVFYQEEWVQRRLSVIQMRWRVAVDTRTGRHILIKRYPRLEWQGLIDDFYGSFDLHHLWYIEPPADGSQPAPVQVESALTEVVNSRLEIRAATDGYRKAIRNSLARTVNELPLDPDLPQSLRETLFAIRGHLARAHNVLDAEGRVWNSIEEGRRTAGNLEQLIAWANRIPDRRSARATEWDGLLERADREIDSQRTTEEQAVASLPPQTSHAEEQFPALGKDLIVRIQRLPARNSTERLMRCRQEIWRLESRGVHNSSEIRRTATVVVVDPDSGEQVQTGSRTERYTAAPSEELEEVFDEYAADELPIDQREISPEAILRP